MKMRAQADADHEVLSEPIATRVLTRASELDAARAAGIAVSDLRAAAAEAGISTPAFDGALAEVRGAADERAPAVRSLSGRWRRTWALAAAGTAALIALGVLGRSRTPTPVAGQTVVEEAIVLRCLSPGEGAELIRPLLTDSRATAVYSPAREPHVLTVRATAEQLQQVKATLDRHDATGSAACTAPARPVLP